MTDMQVQITHHYAEHRGDHHAEVAVAHAYDPGETVAALVARVMGFPLSQYASPDPTQFVTLRVVAGTEPQEESNAEPSF